MQKVSSAKMAMIQGEDSESDEEINTEHLQSLVLTPDGSITGYHGLMKGMAASSQTKTAGIVMGEESETDEEEEGEGLLDGGEREQAGVPGSGASDQASLSDAGSMQDIAKQELVDTPLPAPQS